MLQFLAQFLILLFIFLLNGIIAQFIDPYTAATLYGNGGMGAGMYGNYNPYLYSPSYAGGMGTYATNPLLYPQSMYNINDGGYGMGANGINPMSSMIGGAGNPMMGNVGNYAYSPLNSMNGGGGYGVRSGGRLLNSPFGSFGVTTNNLGSTASLSPSFSGQRQQARNRFGGIWREDELKTSGGGCGGGFLMKRSCNNEFNEAK